MFEISNLTSKKWYFFMRMSIISYGYGFIGLYICSSFQEIKNNFFFKHRAATPLHRRKQGHGTVAAPRPNSLGPPQVKVAGASRRRHRGRGGTTSPRFTITDKLSRAIGFAIAGEATSWPGTAKPAAETSLRMRQLGQSSRRG